MEIFHDSSIRRTVLLALNDTQDADDFCSYLAEDYDVIRCSSADECLRMMSERFAELSAVIIDAHMAKADDYRFLKSVSSDPRLETTPVLVGLVGEPDEDDLGCLAEGAFDFIMPPFRHALVTNRINNAIRMKRSTTFTEIESMLKELPSNIFLKDAEGRYVFATHYWHHLDTGDDPSWTIRGKTDLDIRKDRENAVKAMEADREIIRTGKGTSYVIEINTDGIQEFMQLIKRPVFDDEGNVVGIIALINDVTEHELLKRELEKRARTDELSGLDNHRAFDEMIFSLRQCDEFPVSIISCDCDNLKIVNDTYGHLVGDEYIRMAATVFKVSLPEGAKAFRTGGDEFVAVLKGTSKQEADEIVADMCRKITLFKLEDLSVSVSFGTAEMRSANDDVLEVLAAADRAMYADKVARKRNRA